MKEGLAYNTLLSAPVNLTWEITDVCNLQCSHCLSMESRKIPKRELDFSECAAVIDELDSLKVFQINFGGGEPFLRHDFMDILDYAHSKSITTCVSTNGTVLDDALVKRFKAMDLLRLQVSLDGAVPETNDRIRGGGTYARILNGIELLAKYDIPHTSINTVVTSINFKEIMQLYDLAKFYKAKIRLSRFRPSGSGKEAWNAFHLTKTQLVELSSFLSAHKDVLTGDSFFSITAADRQKLGLNMCGAAKMTCSMLPDGSIYPCAFLQDEEFLAGNIFNESFSSIWNNSPVFNMIRNIRIDACAECPRFNICHGGCPAVAYFLTKSLDCHDPECLVNIQKKSEDDTCEKTAVV